MVLHKTMTMPSSCSMCWISATCEVWVSKTKRYEGYNKRLDECPLEEIEERKKGKWIAKDLDREDEDGEL